MHPRLERVLIMNALTEALHAAGATTVILKPVDDRIRAFVMFAPDTEEDVRCAAKGVADKYAVIVALAPMNASE